MDTNNPQCLIRNLDDPHMPSPPMDCLIAFNKAQNGLMGSNWQIEEVVNTTIASAYVLRIIMRSTKNGEFVFIYTDEDFDNYFKSENISPPESKAIPLMRKNIPIF